MKPTVLAGRYLFFFSLIALAGAPALFANQAANPSKWWNSDLYKRELGLTPEQSRKLEDIFQLAAPTLQKLKKALDDADAQFERIVDQADEKPAVEQINRVVDARAELNRAHSLMIFRMRKILTRDQWTRLGALNQAQERERQKTTEKPAR